MAATAAAQACHHDLGPTFAAAVDGVERGELDELDLSGGHIGDSGVAQLARALLSSPLARATLEELHLATNDIGPAGAALLGEALRAASSSALQELYLRGNRIGSEGAAHLAGALLADGGGGGGGSRLVLLDLAHNGIDARGGAYLADALRSNRSLLRLGLHGNRLGTVGAAALAGALGTGANGANGNSTLAWLNLHGNGVGNAGASALASALRTNGSLRILDLGGANGIGGTEGFGAERAILKLLARNALGVSPRGRMAAFRIHRFWRDVCYDPAYAHARARVIRQLDT